MLFECARTETVCASGIHDKCLENGVREVSLKKIQSSLVLVVLLAATPVWAADGDTDAGFFAKGRKQVTILGGTGSAFNESYIVLGVGASYFVMDGLNVGLHLEKWFDGDPGILKITASSNYVFYKTPRVAPYIGAFYRYTDIDTLDSLSSVGARAGAYLRTGRNGYLGFGVVYESYLSCDTRTYVSCDETYPELSFTFSF
jgi:hypothetical protein